MELIKNIISRGYDYLYNFERNYLKKGRPRKN